MPSILCFGVFELDPAAGELRKDGVLVKLQPQPLKVLGLLASRAGDVVSREELRREVWPDGTFVDFERGLNFCVAQIRGALGDSAESPRFIQTLPRRGYRFVAPVEHRERRAGSAHAPPAVPLEPGAPPAAGPWRPRASLWTMASAIVAIALAVGALLLLPGWWSARPAANRIVLAVVPFENRTGDAAHDRFAESVGQETVTALSRLEPDRLGVIGSAAVLKEASAQRNLVRLKRELGADFVVVGTIDADGERVRVTAHLIRATDQTHVWADAYDRTLQDVLAVQSEIAEQIARSVSARLLEPIGERQRTP